jgi:hypothetical protein
MTIHSGYPHQPHQTDWHDYELDGNNSQNDRAGLRKDNGIGFGTVLYADTKSGFSKVAFRALFYF